MFKVCKSLAALCLAWACLCTAEDAVSPPACSDSVCVINVLARHLIVAPCTDESVLVAYSQASGATLIQCSDPSDPEDTKAFLYNRNDAAARTYEFRGGRFIRPNYLATAASEGIPDKFGAAPLCAAENRPKAAAGELLLAEKRPNDSKDAPYCYRIHYVVARKGTLQVVDDDGKSLPALAPSEVETWKKLRETLSTYIEDPSSVASSTKAQVASVISSRARLFSSPDLADRSKMYLVKGEHVELLDDSKLQTGWCRVRYLNKSGKTIEAWMLARDLDLPQK